MPSPLEVIGSVHSPALKENRRARFAVRGLRSAGFGVVIALLLTGGFGTPLLPNLVTSVCIAMLCWVSIDLGRIPLARWVHRNDPPGSPEAESQWPGWPLMFIAIVVGTFIGFSVGNSLAGLILGHEMPGYFRSTWRQALAMLIGSLVPGLVITYWFYSREVIAGTEAAVLEAQRQAAEHRLKLLESQLEPHMLFNTLANLRVLISVDPPRAQAMLDQLIAFLRATLGGSRASSQPLRAEFARLADYLALMQIRMGDRLQTHFDLPESLAETSVPSLLLQPLVENAIKHGLEPAVAGGRIDVSATREGADLVLRVRDTGTGLHSDANAGEAADGTKFGLTQVRERLAALYGTRASLRLSRVEAEGVDAEGVEADGANVDARATDPARGTLATVRLPIQGLTP